MARPFAPARVDWTARRGQAFAQSIRIEGVDLTGATARAQVRAYPDAATPIFDLPSGAFPIPEGTTTGRCAKDVDLSGLLPVSFIFLWIPKALIDAHQPFATSGLAPRRSLRLAWDCVIDPADDLATAWFAGDFFLEPGVTK